MVDLQYWIKAFLLSLLFSSQSTYADDCPIPYITETGSVRGWQSLSSQKITGIFDQAVYLKQGQYQGQPYVADGHLRPELRLWPELFAGGDLDGQAGDEIVGLLSETNGGSGEQVYLVAAKSADADTVWPAALLGDRVKLRSLSIREQQIVLDVVEAGADQPLCCGTELNRQLWQLANNRLSLIEKQPQGQLSTRTLVSVRWYLLDRPGDRLQAVHPSCTYLSIEGDQIVFEIAGQQYYGKINEHSPGYISISGITSAEANSGDLTVPPNSKLLKQLASVNQYTFRAGRLLLVGFDNQRTTRFEFAIFPAE